MGKKILNLLIAIFLSVTYTATACDYTVNLIDGYGDGWNGATLTVLVNGEIVLDAETLASGAEGQLTFSAETGDEITTTYATGFFGNNEISYEIVDAFGNVVASDGLDYTIPLGISEAIIGNCPEGIFMSVSTTEINFGSVEANNSFSSTFTITNTGTENIEITNIVIDNEIFSVAPTSGTIIPSENLEIAVTVLPETVGEFTGTLTIESNTDDVTINLIGNEEGKICSNSLSYGNINDEAVIDQVLAAGEEFWYEVTLDQTYANVMFNTCGSDFDTKLEVWASCEDDAYLYYADDGGCSGLEYGGDNYASLINVPILDAGTYFVKVYGYSSTTNGIYQLRVLGDIPSSENDFLSFTLDGVEATINNEEYTIAVEVPFSSDLTNLNAIYTLSDGATTEDVHTDFSIPVVYTVTAENSDTQDWTVTVTNSTVANTENDFLTFTLADVDATINNEAHTIEIELPYGTDLTNLNAIYTLSDGATTENVHTDFSALVVYTVIAENSDTENWTVTASLGDNPCDDAIAYGNINGDAIISELTEAGDFAWYSVVLDQDYASVEFSLCGSEFDTKLEIWAGCNDENFIGANDDSYSVCGNSTSNIILENLTEGTYFVKVFGYASNYGTYTLSINEPSLLSEENDFLTFILAEQTNDAIIDTDNHTVNIEVVEGTDLTSLEASFTLSDNAITENNFTDFSENVVYTVVAENGDEQVWTVSVTVEIPFVNPCDDAIAYGNVNGDAVISELTAAGDFAWYSVVLEEDYDAVEFSLCGSEFDTKLEVWESCDAENYLAYDDDGCDAPTSSASVIILEDMFAGTYFVKVYGFSSNYGIYTLSILEDIASDENDFLTFSLNDSYGVINSEDYTIEVEVPYDADLASLNVNYTVSELSSVTPIGITDFSIPVVYTVTAENGDPQEWTITAVLGTDPCLSALDYGSINGEPVVSNTTENSTTAWYSIVLDENYIDLEFSLCGSEFDTRLKLWESCDAEEYIAYNDDASPRCGSFGDADYSASKINLDILSAGTYYVEVYGYNNAYGNYQLNITGTVATSAIIELSDTELDFGDVETNGIYVNNFTITNTGFSELFISNIEVASPFSVDFTETNLETGSSLEVAVTFAPSEDGASSEVLTISSDLEDVSLTLTGNASVYTEGEVCSNPLIYGNINDESITGETTSELPQVWYSVVLDQDYDAVEFSLCDSEFDTKLEVWADCNDENSIGYNDDDCGNKSNIVLENLTEGTYYVKVFGYGSSVGTYTLSVTENILNSDNDFLTFSINGEYGVIDTEEHNINIELDYDANLTDLVASYTFSEGAITEDTFNDFSASVTYTVIAANGETQVWTVNVSLGVNPCDEAIPYGNINGDAVIDSTLEAGDFAWYSVVLEQDYENVEFSLCGSEFDTKLEIWETCDAEDYLAYNDDNSNVCGVGGNSNIILENLTAGTYFVKVYGYSSNFGNYTLSINEPSLLSEENDFLTFILAEQTNDAIIDTDNHTVNIEVVEGTDLTNLEASFTLSENAITENNFTDFSENVVYNVVAENGDEQTWTVSVTVENLFVNNCDNAIAYGNINDDAVIASTLEAGDFAWYSVVLDQDYDAVEFSLCGSEFDTKLEIWANCDDEAYLAYNDDASPFCGNYASSIILENLTAGTYFVKVYGYNDNFGIYTLSIVEDIPSNENDILGFALPEPTGNAFIDTETHTVSIRVPADTDLSYLVADITLSEYANTESVHTNFSNAVVYTVVAENGDVQDWTVTVDYLETGDVDGDGVINIVDIQATINVIINGEEDPGYVAFSDLNNDGVSNIFDLLMLIFMMNSQDDGPAKAITYNSDVNNIISLPFVSLDKNSIEEVIVNFDNEESSISAFELEFTYDASVGMNILSVELVESLNDFNISFVEHETASGLTKVKVIVYTMTANSLPNNIGDLLKITFETSDNASGSTDLSFVSATFTNRDLERIETGVVNGELSILNTTNIENIVSEKMSIYPNPAKDKIFVNGSKIENSNMKIYNSQGQLVLETLLNGIRSIDISELSAGFYTIKIQNDNEIITRKLIKK